MKKVSAWLLKRGKYLGNVFGTYFVHFPKGRAEVLPGLEAPFQSNTTGTGLPFEEHVEHEIYGKGMYYNRCYGSCTSTAIYLTTCLRAVGIPTRMILAIPIVDTSDPGQRKLVETGIRNRHVRQAILTDLPSSSSFSAHTFNEVQINGRWRRLNYQNLDQNIYGPGAMGMLTHVLTFGDLSEANLAPTWGKRYGLRERDKVFRGTNPYCTTELSDRFGIHSKIQRSSENDLAIATIIEAYWFFSDQRPNWIKENLVTKGRDGHFLVRVDPGPAGIRVVYDELSKEFVLKAPGQRSIRAHAERGYWNNDCYFRIPRDEFEQMKPGVPYSLEPLSQADSAHWKVGKDVTLTRAIHR